MMRPAQPDRAGDAALAACMLAADPAGLGGASLRGGTGPARDWFVAMLGRLAPAGAPFRRVPPSIDDGRLIGGLDLAATLQAGRPVLQRGLLADTHGGFAVVAMAERLAPAAAARLASALDCGDIAVERDGFGCRFDAQVAVIALDEGAADDERPPPALLERLAFHIDLDGMRQADLCGEPFAASAVERARKQLSGVAVDDGIAAALCRTAAMAGIGSVRAALLALRAARVHAALSGRVKADDEDAAAACRLVLAPRASVLPDPPEEDASGDETSDAPEQGAPDPPPQDDDAPAAGALDDMLIEATRAAIPPDLLARLVAEPARLKRSGPGGHAGAPRSGTGRGRPAGSRPGDPMRGARLNVVETLRAAAPWQPLRRKASRAQAPDRVLVRRDDFRIVRHKHKSETATIFVVDASGSSALNRLAEAKGAVELLLAECYVRRDQVALISFRGRQADLILPPTRSLARAKRILGALPGGGGTPLATAIEASVSLADRMARRGFTPSIVLMTDGKANVGRDGAEGRERAQHDAAAAARACRGLGLRALLIDTSPFPGEASERLAAEMGAVYLPLPRADASAISRAARMVAPGGAPQPN